MPPRDVSRIPLIVDGADHLGGELSPETQDVLRHVISVTEKRDAALFELQEIDTLLRAYSIAFDEMASKELGLQETG
jgi:hypothetical protein